MAEGTYDQLNSLYTAPLRSRPVSLEGLMWHQPQGAPKGLQQEATASWAVDQCFRFLETMYQEEMHLR